MSICVNSFTKICKTMRSISKQEPTPLQSSLKQVIRDFQSGFWAMASDIVTYDGTIFLQRWGVFVGYNRHFHHPMWYLWTVAGHYEMNGTEEVCNTLICSVKIFLYRAKISITQLRTDICNSLMYVCNCGTAVCNRVMEILKGTKKIFWGYWGKCSVGTHDEAWSSVMALFLPI